MLFQVILSIAISALSVSATNFHSNSRRSIHQSHGKRAELLAPVALSDPANLSVGSLNVANGCTDFFEVPAGHFCYKVAADNGITLEEFYAMNPQLFIADSGSQTECGNLWADYSYCIAGVITPNVAASSIPPAVVATSVTKVSTSASRMTTTSRPIYTPVSLPAVSAPSPSSTSTSTYSAPESTSTPESIPMSFSTPESIPTPASTPEPAPSSTQLQPAPVPSPAALAVAPQSSGSNLLASAGISGFLGTNYNAIASWFRTDNPADSTNGNSWCGFPYNSNTPGFAPDVTTMLNNFGGNYEAAATAYCGLEAEFTTPDGRTATFVLADGFDSKWVLTPSSIDIVQSHFDKLFGSWTDNKNDVVQNVQWKFTGNRNPQYVFKGQGN